LLACGSTTPSPAVPPAVATDKPSATNAATSDDEPAAGHITRDVVQALPKWAAMKDHDDTKPDEAGARALKDVPAGATVRVFLGTWCGDSRREVTRLWRALDVAGGAVPFTLEYIAVDHAKTAPEGLTDGIGLRYVPTIVVMRGGKEVGRIIESSPGGIENDLRALLEGERSGIISGRTDVGA
jgi:hypothetical protein